MLGFGAHFWEQLMLGSLAVVGVAGVAVALFTAAVIISQRRENSEAKAEFERYKLETGETIANANKAAADANERAAEANLKAESERIERLKLEAKLAPRTLSVEQFEILSHDLQGISFPISLTAISEPESMRFAEDIQRALQAAGLNVQLSPIMVFSKRPPTGLRISGPKGMASRVGRPFLKAGIKVTGREKEGDVEILVGSKSLLE